MNQKLTNAFPLWVTLASILAFIYPPLFTWFTGLWITLGLGIIMLGMGITLKVEDFTRVVRYPAWIGAGLLLQYTVMPLSGWCLGYLFDLPTPFHVGLVLVASCPGGTASNVIAFLAKANVAVSVTMTALSTFLAVMATPLITTGLVGSRVDVNTLGLFLSAVQVIILPVSLGLMLRRYAPRLTKRILPWSPLAAVIMITMIVASIIGAGKQDILDAGLRLVLAVFFLHVLGFVLGYFLGWRFTKNQLIARTISIEVGMQNSGLGVVLARQNFANPLVAIPSAISSLCHCLIGSFVASLWRKEKSGHERAFLRE